MKPITIVGGGLAGLTLGIALRQRGAPVTIFEAGHYPRHRVCGEFISGAGVGVLQTLQLEQLIQETSRAAMDCAFFAANRLLFRRKLPHRAVAVSRFDLDAALARRFCELGGTLREAERWRDGLGEGVVWAAGRRARPVEKGWRWFGLKVHADNVALEADLEMHLARSSYIGLCRLSDGAVNVCGLFRRRVDEPGAGHSMDWLRGIPGSPLFERLAEATLDVESFCAVAGLSLQPERINPHDCRVGDALTMIPPITGNGMSIAFESAQVAVPPLLAYAQGSASWPETTATIAEALHRTLGGRLRRAALLHRVLFSSWQRPALRLLKLEPAWQAAFAATR